MAIASTTVWEVRTDGSDGNGGGFDPAVSSPGTDYSQQAAAQKTGTALTMHASVSTKVNPVGQGVSAADVGNIINIYAQTGAWTLGWYIITAQDGTYWTLDRSPGPVSHAPTASYRMGGAFATPGFACGKIVANNTIYIKSGTYSITSVSPNVANGILQPGVGGTAANPLKIIGYNSTRGDGGTKPLLQASGSISSFAIVANNSGTPHVIFDNLSVDCAGKASSRGIRAATSTSGCVIRNCHAANATVYGIECSYGIAYNCTATGCSGSNGAIGGSNTCVAINCVAYDNTCVGFKDASGGLFLNCIADSNSGSTTDGFVSSGTMVYVNCVAYNNGRDGFVHTGTLGAMGMVGCISFDNVRYGFNINAGSFNAPRAYFCAGYSNATADFYPNNDDCFVSKVTLTADPFTNAASGDFSLNATAGGGAACKQLQWVMPNSAGTSYYDLGPVLPASTANTGFPRFGDMTGGLR